MDQGIIHSLKCSYKTEFLRRLLKADACLENIKDYKKHFNIKCCIDLLEASWNSVSQDTLVNAWHNIWPSSMFIDTECNNIDFSGFRLSKSQEKSTELLIYAKHSNIPVPFQADDITDWIMSVDEHPVTNQLTDHEIISNVLGPSQSDQSDSDTDSDSEVEKITFSQGLALGDQYLKFLEQQSCVSQQDIMSIYRLQEKLQREVPNVLKQTTIEAMFSKCKNNLA